MRAATFCLFIIVQVLLWPARATADPILVSFIEGATHGFLTVRTADGVPIGSGDLLQIARGDQIESRMIFHFKDRSVFDERVSFSQQHLFTMQNYRLVQRGPVFSEDSEISLKRPPGTIA